MNNINEIQEKLKRGYLEMLILQLLTKEDMYGYQLKAEIEENSSGLLILTEGVLYPPLYRMIQKGYISERKETVCKRRVRVYYHIEEPGKDFLDILRAEYLKTFIGVNKIMDFGDFNEQTQQTN